jgi:hypothetical protein
MASSDGLSRGANGWRLLVGPLERRPLGRDGCKAFLAACQLDWRCRPNLGRLAIGAAARN